MTAGPYSIGSDLLPGTSKVIEEMGEALQVLGKFMGTGGDELHWDGSNLGIRVVEEFGDVLGAIRFWSWHNMSVSDRQAMRARSDAKVALFEKWHREQQAGADSVG